MKLTILGYYGGYPYDNVGTSGYLLQSDDFNLLIDCGSSVLITLENVLDPLKLNAVVLSHYHADHIADVGVLQYYWQLHEKRYKDDILPIYGSSYDKTNFDALDWPNSTKKKAFNPDGVNEIGPFDITFKKTIHPVAAYAMRIKERKTGKVLAYTADSRYFAGLTAICKNADLLIADTNFFANKAGEIWHMTSAQVGRLAKDANVKKLLISHLPQVGNLDLLLKESQNAAGNDINLILPLVGKTIDI